MRTDVFSARRQQKSAHYEIRTRAGFPPADLESAALDRSAKCAFDTVQSPAVPFIRIWSALGEGNVSKLFLIDSTRLILIADCELKVMRLSF